MSPSSRSNVLSPPASSQDSRRFFFRYSALLSALVLTCAALVASNIGSFSTSANRVADARAAADVISPPVFSLVSPLTKSAISLDPGNTKQTGATFSYRLAYNCSSTSGPCLNAEVVDLLPATVQFVATVPASPSGDVAAVNVTANYMGSGRTRVQFVMITPLPAGNSGDLLVDVRFPNGSTPDGTVATNTADGINLGTSPGTVTTPPVNVTAVATTQVSVAKTLTSSPANLDLPESYRLRIANSSNNGTLNLTSIGPVTDTLPPGTIFNGASPAADCQPGCVGTTPATVTWTAPCSVPLGPGGNCDVNVNVTFPSATFPSGTNVTNSFTATGTPLGKPSQNFGVGQVTHPVTTFVPSPSAGFTKNMASNTPNPPTLNQTFSYDLNISNSGNVPLDNMVVIDTLPVAMQLSSVTTGSYNSLSSFAAGVGVRVSYEKNTAPGVFTLWGSSPNTTTNTTLTTPPPGLGAGEYITRIKWEYGSAAVGMSSATRPLVTGKIINPNNAGGPVGFGNTIQNCADLTAVYTAGPTNVNQTDCESFTLSGPYVQLNPGKDNLSGGPFNPGQAVAWRLRVRSASQSSDPAPLQNLVAVDLLPADLVFVSWTFDDQGTGLPAPQSFQQIPNYAGTGRTLLRWTWNAGSGNLGVNQQVFININTTIRNGAQAGSLSNDFLLGSNAPGLSQRCSGSSQTDSLDLNGDSNTADTLCRTTGTATVAAIAQLVSSKTVQGTCDGGFVSNSAGTLAGGKIDYLTRVQNVGTVPMQNLVLIDILPFVGDTGVRDTNPRGSQFTPLLGQPITPPAGTTIYYSTSGNPCRGEVGGPTTSCDPPNWSTVPPTPITSARSIKVEFGSRIVAPFDFLDFKINMIAPASLSAGATAYNSFAYQADRSDGLGSLAAEPQKVGVALGSCDAAVIGDYVFADSNGNGIQDDGPTGINNVPVRLFAPGPDGIQGTLDDVLLGTTITANSPSNAPGWYRFPGLAPGSYFVCTSLPPNFVFSPPHAAGNSLDSDADTATGCSGIVTLAPNQTNNDLDAGLVPTQRGTIGNYVWFDLNSDGIQNDGPSAGANGVTVRLFAHNASDTLVATTVTADDESHRPGYYSFGGLTPGQQYFVQFVLPASSSSFTTADSGGDDTVDSDAAAGTGLTPLVTLAAGEFNRTFDAGLMKPSGTLSLGDQVWLDSDNDGVFEPQNGEVGVDGVLLWLYRDVNNNGLPDTDEYSGQTSTSTNAGFSGRYSFGGLAAGNYLVVVPSSNFVGSGPLVGKTSSTGNSPAPDPDDDVNGDDNGRTIGSVLGSLPVTLTASGEPTSEDGDANTNLTVDFGFTNASGAAAPTISKAFGAPFVQPSGTTTLTITITNPNGGQLSDIGFNDPLPTGLIVATPNGLTGSCLTTSPPVTNAGSVTAVAGSTSISMSSLALAGGGSCTVTVNTTATTLGVKNNRTDNVIAAEGLIGGTASATLTTCSTNPIVTTLGDSGTGTLRQAISDACPGSTITFAAGLTSGGSATITLTSAELLIDKNLTITGANLLTVERSSAGGTPNFHLFRVTTGSTVSISGLTLTNGAGTSGLTTDGGGIYSQGSLTLSDSVITGNNASNGGGIYNAGTLIIANSTISNNHADTGAGGGIYDAGNLTVANSTISSNSAFRTGGVEVASGIANIINSTISGNLAIGAGGGIQALGGTTTVTNGSVVNNHSDSDNTGGTDDGGGIRQAGGTLKLRNTIVAGNYKGSGTSAPNDIFGALDSSSSFNLIGTGGSGGLDNSNGNQVGVANSLLGVLANNGGPTQTHLLLPGSPAINAGSNALAIDQTSAALTTDQRGTGFNRIVNTTVDIGAVEVNYTITSTAGTPQSAVINTAFATVLKATVKESGTNQAGVPVTFTAPVSGASGSFSGSATVNTDSGGIATGPTFTANGIAGGPYNVVASLTGGTPFANFALTNTPGDQAITFGVLPTRTIDDPDFTVSATASSGLPVSFTASGQCTVAANTVHITGVGSCTITAKQGGNANYNAAPDLPRTFAIIGALISLSQSNYAVNENTGFVTITVNRTGALSVPFSVDYATSDTGSSNACGTLNSGLASSRCDFGLTLGTLKFAANETQKTFVIPITQDSYTEGPEMFTVDLSGLSGANATFAVPSTATVTISDSAAPAPNAIDDAQTFVRQHYRDFLNREADPAGLAFWTNQITSCGADAQCTQLKRINVSSAFFLSIEFQATGGTAYLTNKVAFGGLPTNLRFQYDAQALGRNYVFGATGAEAILEANKVAYFNSYVSRPEFTNTYDGLSNQSFVNTLILNTGVTFTPAERDALVNGLANSTETRATVLRKIAEKPSFQQIESNTMFVLMEYFGYLRRDPDSAGFNFWLNKLNQFNGNFIQADMVKAFINSEEYRRRFGL